MRARFFLSMGVAVSEYIPKGVAKTAQLAEFDTLIDARSPSEYRDDHIPGAISCPVLDDEERSHVGTLYVQVSPFEARKVGAALVAKNIARHLEEHFLDRPKQWRPLVYCWRGGQRSGAFTHILREIGWDAHRLEGGYKTWRRTVITTLEQRPAEFRFIVLAGATGSAKSRLLEALADEGAQTLHLEALAAHKGSVLGGIPNQPQPSQKAFETRLYTALAGLKPEQPVFVEAESRRIGTVQMPNALLDGIRAGRCIRIEASVAARVEFLLRDYDYFLADRASLTASLARLQGLQSNTMLAGWQQLAEHGEFATLVTELLEEHYDPLYRRSQGENYLTEADARVIETDSLLPEAIRLMARQIVAGERQQSP
jgi:tRNA 2-selenouridine synthase